VTTTANIKTRFRQLKPKTLKQLLAHCIYRWFRGLNMSDCLSVSQPFICEYKWWRLITHINTHSWFMLNRPSFQSYS